MTLQTRLGDLITSLGTDYKNFKTWMFGSLSGSLADLDTTDKSSFVAAINEALANGGGTPPDASTTVKGIVELATDAEAITGTDALRAVTPSNVDAVFDDRIDTSSSLGSSNVKVPSQAAVKAYADALLELNDVLQFKGAIDASSNPNYPAANKGHFYKISVAGKIGGASGPNVQAGDSIYCITDGSAAGNEAAVGANWVIVQVNIDGAVIGPASSTNLALAIYSGTTGKLISDSAVVISIDGTFAANSDAKVPTEKAVKTYTAATYYNKTELGDPETDLAAAYATAKT